MSDLINKIKAAQMMAGEQEVIKHLKESGLLPTPPATVIQPLQKLFELRNELYDSLPSGQIDAFELIRVISDHIKKLDKLIDESTPTNQPLQWVKASERKPNIISKEIRQSKRLHLKTFGTYAQIGIYYSDNNEFELWDTDGKKTTFNHASFHLIEWLDESTPPNQLSDIEGICQNCNGKNPTWYADNELFNKVNGSPNGIICPSCFEKKAEEMGINIIFKAGYAASEPSGITTQLLKLLENNEKIIKYLKEPRVQIKVNSNAASEGEEAIGVLDWIVENKWVGEFDDFCGYMWYQITESGTSNYINSNQLANIYKLSKK